MAPINNNSAWTAALAPQLSAYNNTTELFARIYDLMREQAEYEAMRVYLGVNHPQILARFDAAYTARKRLEVK